MALPIPALVEARRALAGAHVEVCFLPGRGVPCCSLRRQGEQFVMNGISGTHCLVAVATDLSRLAAHWAGFREVNLQRAAAALAG